MIGSMVRHYLTTGITTGILLITALGSWGHNPAMAEAPGNSRAITSLPANDWSFWPTDDDKAPRTTVSGASRGNCDSEQVTALLPRSHYGQTTKAHPEILVATSADTPRLALLSIQNLQNAQNPQSDDYYYETYIELPDTPGVVSIALPNDAPALAANAFYQWSLILMCNDQLRPDSPALQGWIQTQPATHSTADVSLEQAIEYREAHLWYDMVSLVADLRSQAPHDPDIREAWQGILTAIDLAEMVNEPIIE
ncbi:DUF928 domain-containing protein [Leptothoe sp. PORK10 BA2]|uniref:DUF928 domain-containing protein n=1 Tax=Leptothoe sp. PORK10 BA2 TaxID=3110254 RepID=UPI002B209EC8|nr:DUF928 domain-containing protein [Leptothoe sp. PORK10 BA2]MEA5466755.1 DUF928 domain-containing protein [Leptothoe sp. PORK10 BA2]